MIHPYIAAFAEFPGRPLKLSDLEPTLGSIIKNCPPEKIMVISEEFDSPQWGWAAGAHHLYQKVEQIKVVSRFDKASKRWGFRSNDLFKGAALLRAAQGVEKLPVVAFDADMIVMPGFEQIIDLVKNFKVCIPANNPRWIVGKDARAEADGSPWDGPHCAMAYNMTPIAVANSANAARLIVEYMDQMTRKPCRGPLAMARAVWESRVVPYVLPPQWCVCAGQEGIGNEMALHVGHQSVKEFYKA